MEITLNEHRSKERNGEPEGLKESENFELIFQIRSTIRTDSENTTLERPKVACPPRNLRLRCKETKYNSIPIEGNRIRLKKHTTTEFMEFVYDVENPLCPIEDEHLWTCPVDGFKLTARLPEEYKIEISILEKPIPEDMIPNKPDGRVQSFSYDLASLPKHGFNWSIKRKRKQIADSSEESPCMELPSAR